ncbi:unnamed protein product [Knipowitschia caucasica]
MEAVLERALVLSLGKLLVTLPLLRSALRSVSSPVSFCCCCLLLFTDAVLTIFFSSLLILRQWQLIAPSAGDIIAQRSLLFTCNTYGAVFFLTLPEIVVDILIRHLQLLETDDHCQHHDTKRPDDTPGADEREKTPNWHHFCQPYLCSLALWIFAAINIRLSLDHDDAFTIECLYSTQSILTCFPNIHSPMMSALPPCWAMALVYFPMCIFISISIISVRPKEPANTGANANKHSCPVQKHPIANAKHSPGHNIEDKDYEGTEKVIGLMLVEETKSARPQSGSGFGAEVMIGVVCAIAMFVLPLFLTVNIHLVSAVDKLLERSVKYYPRRMVVYGHTETV